jgi:hypothetical protein
MFKKPLIAFAAVLVAFTLAGCDVDVEDEGELPKVKVEPGRAPDVDVRGPDVHVGSKETTVTVPDIDVDTKETDITVPDIDVDIPDEEDNEP